MSAPKISVIVPNYNHSIYLRQRIDSILNQTYRNIEIIILDDHSSDNSREVIQEYMTNPLVHKVIFNDQNSGSPFKQWQRGIEIATGQWVWLAESDDYADKRFLELMVSALQNHDNVGLVYCDSKIVSEDNRSLDSIASLKNRRFHTNRWHMDHSNRGLDEIEDYLLPGGTINNASAVLFNKAILLDVNPFDIDLRYIGDKYAYVKVLSRSNVVYVKESLNYFRDPFNAKHVDKFVYYFYEQFLVFNWAYRNLVIKNKQKFFQGFHANTRNSLFRGWNKSKLLLYGKLFSLNGYLLIRSILHNLRLAFRSVLGCTDHGE